MKEQRFLIEANPGEWIDTLEPDGYTTTRVRKNAWSMTEAHAKRRLVLVGRQFATPQIVSARRPKA